MSVQYMDAWDLTFPFHWDDVYSDGHHYSATKNKMVEYMFLQILLNRSGRSAGQWCCKKPLMNDSILSDLYTRKNTAHGPSCTVPSPRVRRAGASLALQALVHQYRVPHSAK